MVLVGGLFGRGRHGVAGGRRGAGTRGAGRGGRLSATAYVQFSALPSSSRKLGHGKRDMNSKFRLVPTRSGPDRSLSTAQGGPSSEPRLLRDCSVATHTPAGRDADRFPKHRRARGGWPPAGRDLQPDILPFVPPPLSIALVGCGAWGKNILRDLVSLGCEVNVVARSEASISRAREGNARSIVDSVEALPGQMVSSWQCRQHCTPKFSMRSPNSVRRCSSRSHSPTTR